jgi:hypothetical protein
MIFFLSIFANFSLPYRPSPFLAYLKVENQLLLFS